MAILSRLLNVAKTTVNPVRSMGGIGGQVQNRPSRWNYDIFKDHIHFYVMLGVVPLGLAVLFANIYEGPAVLKPIPEGYVPQEHEYYRSPVTRWFVKYVYPSQQQSYEQHLCQVWEEQKVTNMYQLMREVKRVQKIHQDYKGWYVREVDHASYLRASMKNHSIYEDTVGYVLGDEEVPKEKAENVFRY
eukprot:TRINITY_DN1538_c0_g1_i1.p1 TRINITY_DN1538_c0_g1~~TRINITY_DN1538_c0_g1_i1.p1  ORF type:complete len:188 (+),score=31.84 TRINITY_DN1538_c0_g1_i1:43-606(+)